MNREKISSDINKLYEGHIIHKALDEAYQVGLQLYNNAIVDYILALNQPPQLDGLQELQQRIKKLEYMIENGLGWEDMENDITYPKEL